MKSYLALFSFLVILSSCSKNPVPSTNINNSDSSMSALINGVEWGTNNISTINDSLSNNLIAIVGNGAGTIKLSVITFPAFDSGSYNFRPANIDSNSTGLLTTLSAQSLSSGVRISWAVTNGNDLSHFILQRSTDGVNFTEIGTVQVSNSATNYSFEDIMPAPLDYYRIEMVATNGEIEYSSIVVAHFSSNNFAEAFYNGIPGSNGNITIVSNDAVNRIITGTFSFDCVNSSNQLIFIRNGKFNIHY
jgi:hypothetical protein